MSPVIELRIHHLAPGHFVVESSHLDRSDVSYDSIAHLLREIGADLPREVWRFANVFYKDACPGTLHLDLLVKEAEAVAAKLVEIVAEINQEVP